MPPLRHLFSLSRCRFFHTHQHSIIIAEVCTIMFFLLALKKSCPPQTRVLFTLIPITFYLVSFSSGFLHSCSLLSRRAPTPTLAVYLHYLHQLHFLSRLLHSSFFNWFVSFTFQFSSLVHPCSFTILFLAPQRLYCDLVILNGLYLSLLLDSGVIALPFTY